MISRLLESIAVIRNNRSVIARLGSAVFVLQLIGVATAFAVNLYVARILPNEVQFGIFAYAISWVNVLALPSVAGMDTTILRHCNRRNLNGNLIRYAVKYVATSSSVTVVFASIAASVSLCAARSLQVALPYAIAIAIIPVAATLTVAAAVLRSREKTAFAVGIVSLVRPATVGLVLWALAYKDLIPTRASDVLFIYLVSYAIALSLAMAASPFTVGRSIGSPSQRKKWREMSLTVLTGSGFQKAAAHLDVIVIASIVSFRDAAVYAVASRLVGLVTFGLTSSNTVVAPMIASAHQRQSRSELESIVRSASRIVFLLTAPLVVGLIVFGKPTLLLYKHQYLDAYPVVLVLCIGECVNAGCGCVGFLLMMTDHEKVATRIMVVSSVFFIITSGLMTYQWGIIGAAAARSISTAVKNLWMLRIVWTKLLLNPTIFPLSPAKAT